MASSAKSKSRSTSAEANDDEVDDYELVHDLLPAAEIVITDDQLSSAVFASSFFSAPQEDLLEKFYAGLGSPRLSSLVKEEYKEIGAEIKTDRAILQSDSMRKLILERLPLFLHDMRATNRTLVLTWEWLNKPDNLQVKLYSRIARHMTYQRGAVRKAESHEVSASAKHLPASTLRTGPLALSLSDSTPLDMYEYVLVLLRCRGGQD